MTMKIKLFGIVLLSILFTGCPDVFFIPDPSEEEHGLLIVNYPEWCEGEINTEDRFSMFHFSYHCYGYSDWKNWNSSEGELIFSLVDKDLVPEVFDGKYRLVVINQYLYVCFNDKKMTNIRLHNYYGDYERENNNQISINQSSKNVFEYDAALRGEITLQMYGKRSHVRLEKKTETQFTYKLDVDGKTYVTETMINYKAEYGSAIFPMKVEEYEWLPKNGMDFDVGNKILGPIFDVNGNSLSIGRGPGNSGNIYLMLMYCFEGISLRNIDGENKTVSYNFLDAGKNGHCDYFEIKIDTVTDEDRYSYKGTLAFYKIVEEKPVELYRYTTPEKWIEGKIDYGENTVEFF